MGFVTGCESVLWVILCLSIWNQDFSTIWIMMLLCWSIWRFMDWKFFHILFLYFVFLENRLFFWKVFLMLFYEWFLIAGFLVVCACGDIFKLNTCQLEQFFFRFHSICPQYLKEGEQKWCKFDLFAWLVIWI